MVITMLESIIKDVLKKLEYPTDYLKVIKSNRRDLCDYQCDTAFLLAKVLHKSPIVIANSIVLELKGNDRIKSIEAVNPGFINITLSDEFINEILNKMFNEPKYGLEKMSAETYFLDYGGPNIAKPLHVGHLRSAVVGESIKRIINYMGHKTIADVHLGDYGLQIGEVIYGIKKYNVSEITLSFLDKIYPEMSALCKEDESVKEECALITKELQDGNEEYQKLFKKIALVSKNDIKEQYDYLDVSFDLWEGESDAYPYIPRLTEILNQKHLLVKSEGALVIDVSEETDKKELPPLIYQKSNGAYLYGTTDLATILKRYEVYKPDHIIYTTDLRQGLHFNQVFRSAYKAEIAPSTDFSFAGFGTVNGIDGKPFKTRSGNVPKLSSLFKEVETAFINTRESNQNIQAGDLKKIVNAIIKYADLSNNREKDYIFDISKFIEVVGKTGPYILYTYLRIRKVLDDNSYDITFDKVYNDIDRELRIKLIELEQSIKCSYNEYMPHYIAEYIYELATVLNTFYQNNHIKVIEDKKQKDTWLTVLKLSSDIIKDMLYLLGIEIPTMM